MKKSCVGTKIVQAVRCLVAVGFVAILSEPASANDCIVSKDQYTNLKMKMTYSEAVKILGCAGNELSSSEVAGFKTEMYMWNGDSTGANMNAMFQNGKLINKAQFGLK